jgi:formate dehydrogenase alpha subunit
VAGLAAAFGAGAMTNSIQEIEDTDTILVIGSNTTSQHPMIASRVIRAKHKGAKLVVIDPRRIPLVEYADLFIRPRPGTNVALLNGMLRTIIDKNLIDADFIEAQTEGFEEVKAKVAEYTPQRVAEITGVDPDMLERAAEIYGRADKAMILYAMGVTQQTAGTDNVKAVANLALATGNLGRFATGVNPLRGQNNVQGACDMGALPNVLTGYKKVADAQERERFAAAWSLPLPETPGLTVGEMLQAAHKGELKGLYVVGENPMISDPDVNHVRKALESLDLLVVQDIFMTETAQLADVVLPGASFAEKDGTFTNTDRRVQRVRQAIEPVGDSKPDWRIVCQLAKELGAGDFDFAGPAEIMEEIASLTPSYGGITYERLDRGEVLQWPCLDASHPGTPYLHANGFPRGKGKFHAVDHTPPAEAPDAEYPYLLSTGRIPFHFHGGSMTMRIERLQSEAPDAFVDIHPDNAKRLEVEQGDEVSVRSRRGEILVKVRVTDEVEPDVVFIPMHYPESPVNKLTDNRVDPVAKIPNLKVCAVNIHKPAEG